MVASINKMTIRTTKSHTTSFKLRTAGILRNLIAICFLVSVALGGDCYCKGWGCDARSFTLTTAKDRFEEKLASTMEVRYHPTRTHVNRSGNNHKFEKVRSWALNEWFSITKMLDHDKANNCILVQIHGMKNRWIYYLEHDAMDFIELLKEEGMEKAVDVNLRSIAEPVRKGRVEGLPCKCRIGEDYRGKKNWDKASRKTNNGFTKSIYQGEKCELNICGGSGRVFPTQEELKRGDVANGVYGFRVKLQKDGKLTKKLTPNNFSGFFDDVSVCVYLKECHFCDGTGRTDAHKNPGTREESWHQLRRWRTLGSCNDADEKCKSCDGKGFFNKVEYITIPNWGNALQAHITSINCFQEFPSYSGDKKGSVVVRLKRVPGTKRFNITGPSADRELGLGGEGATGIEGKKLLKFLNDHAGNYEEGKPTYIDDSSLYKKFVATITADWDLNKLPHPDQETAPALLRQSNANNSEMSGDGTDSVVGGDPNPNFVESNWRPPTRLAYRLASSHDDARRWS